MVDCVFWNLWFSNRQTIHDFTRHYYEFCLAMWRNQQVIFMFHTHFWHISIWFTLNKHLRVFLVLKTFCLLVFCFKLFRSTIHFAYAKHSHRFENRMGARCETQYRRALKIHSQHSQRSQSKYYKYWNTFTSKLRRPNAKQRAQWIESHRYGVRALRLSSSRFHSVSLLLSTFITLFLSMCIIGLELNFESGNSVPVCLVSLLLFCFSSFFPFKLNSRKKV